MGRLWIDESQCMAAFDFEKKMSVRANKIICGISKGILILLGSLRCLKEAKTTGMILDKCKLQNSFPCFSNKYYNSFYNIWYF